jgi:hypothetical protein
VHTRTPNLHLSMAGTLCILIMPQPAAVIPIAGGTETVVRYAEPTLRTIQRPVQIRQSGRSRPETPVAQRDDHWSRPSREIRR